MWQKYRRAKWRLIVLALGWMPFGVLIWSIASLNRELELVSFLIVVYALYLFYTLVQFELIRCPNCGVRLHFRRSFRTCGGCGIGINRDSEWATSNLNPARTDGWAPQPYLKWLRRRWKRFTVTFIVFSALIVLLLTLVITQSVRRDDAKLRDSDVTKLTIAAAEANPALGEKLGRPLKTEGPISGYVSKENAQIEISVSGPRGSGVLGARLRRQGNTWQIHSLLFRGKGDAVNLDLLAVQSEKPTVPR
jgi:Cytochrome oxidase complex assembly protein 1